MNGGEQLDEALFFVAELFASGGRNGVVARALVVRRLPPLGLDPPLLPHALQGGIERAFLDGQHRLRERLNRVGDLVEDFYAASFSQKGVTYDHLEAAPLVGPGARLKVAIGPNSFTEADQFAGAGDPFKIGGGPHVLFEGGKFFGIQFFGVNAKGAAFVTAGAAPEPFDFAGGDFSAGGPSYAGDFDYAKVKVTSVPEPAAWTLMICGFGAAGAVLRRRRGVSGQWSSHGI